MSRSGGAQHGGVPNQGSSRLLAIFPQFPYDAASGAIISDRTICEMLASVGWQVTVLATTASELYGNSDHLRTLEKLNIEFLAESISQPSGRPVYRFRRRGVEYVLLDTGTHSVNESRRAFIPDLDALVSAEACRCAPDIVLTYGSSEAEVQRRAMVRATGALVVFSLHNRAYHHARSFQEVDAIVTPSRFITEYYRQQQCVESMPLPRPICLEDIIAPRREPIFFTMINPSLEKGLLFFLRLLPEAARRWPRLPFMVVESRGSVQLILAAARKLGIDLQSTRNLHLARSSQDPWRIYAATRVLLVPSLVEAASRVAVEAQLNGIPVLASDRDGLPETVGSGGYILPVEDEGGPPGEILERWLRLIGRLHDDSAFFEAACCAASDAVHRYHTGEVDRQWIAFFQGALEGKLQPLRPVEAK
jgi:glycosyltransferase involved in cell wall biosynthesis